jgi:hypothetical protein
MPSLICLSLTILIMLNAALTAQQRFAKYQKIEAYEIRPGILMMPRDATDGEVCEIGLEKLHYSPKVIRVDTTISREEVFEILDEIVPAAERGKPSEDLLDNDISIMGQVRKTNIGFDNVSIQIYGTNTPSADKKGVTVNQVVATVKWKQRICR